METNIQNNKIHINMSITILNIVFGLGIVLVPVVAFFMVMFADTQSGADTAKVFGPMGFYYPLVALISIYMSRRTNSYWWAFLPLLFLAIYPIVGTISPRFFGAPVNWLFKLIFGSKLF